YAPSRTINVRDCNQHPLDPPRFPAAAGRADTECPPVPAATEPAGGNRRVANLPVRSRRKLTCMVSVAAARIMRRCFTSAHHFVHFSPDSGGKVHTIA